MMGNEVFLIFVKMMNEQLLVYLYKYDRRREYLSTSKTSLQTVLSIFFYFSDKLFSTYYKVFFYLMIHHVEIMSMLLQPTSVINFRTI